MKKILLVVDMQNDFITGPLGNEDCKAVVEPIRKLITEQSWDTIRFTADEHIKANGLFGGRLLMATKRSKATFESYMQPTP